LRWYFAFAGASPVADNPIFKQGGCAVTNETAVNNDALTLRNAAAKAAWGVGSGVGTVVLTTVLAFVGNYITNGGVVRLLGGLSVSQIADAQPIQAHTNCPDVSVVNIKGAPDKTFCFLTDVSIRQGNSITSDNVGGWSVCKIEPDSSGKSLQLVAQMDGKCSASSPKGPEITCKAKCISY
jgi:hypothetical protein